MLCKITQLQHQHTQQHIDNVARYLGDAWHVVGAKRLVNVCGIEIVHEVALEMAEANETGAASAFYNPGGYIYSECNKRAGTWREKLGAPSEQPRYKSAPGGGRY